MNIADIHSPADIKGNSQSCFRSLKITKQKDD